MSTPQPIDSESRAAERRKWDAYYDALPLVGEDPLTRAFNDEFAARILAFLPRGARTLEAGCGAGWQSLALSRAGQYDVHLMDFSPRALAYSKRIFEGQGLAATFIEEDISRPGTPDFDLVFNAGVLEHYTFDEQAALLRSMASRSRRWVLALVPNALCYWYWLWRVRKAASSDWPFGKEVPLADLSAVFEAAGLHFAGHAFLGAAWSEAFIQGLPGMDPELAGQILEIHRSPVIPVEQRSYLVAALGSVTPEPAPARWTRSPDPEKMDLAETRAIVADSLALRLQSELQRKEERREAAEALQAVKQASEAAVRAETEKWSEMLRAETRKWEDALRHERRTIAGLYKHIARMEKGARDYQTRFDAQLAEYRVQRAWKLMLAFRKAYTALARGKMEAAFAPLEKFDLDFPSILNFLPGDLPAPPPDLARVRTTRASRRYDVVILPIFDFEFRFQRPQQLAMQFARAGHRVFWVSPRRLLPPSSAKPYEMVELGENVWEVRLRGEPFDLYRGALPPGNAKSFQAGLEALYRDLDIVSSCVLLQFPFWREAGLALRDAFGTKIVYDCMDDWQNWPTEPLPGEYSLAAERKLVGEADVLVVTSRALHERHAANGIESRLIPNAADFDFFHNAPSPLGARSMPRPIVGYFGAIADWFDLELMTAVARSRPQYSFLFIGHVHVADISPLQSLPNVRLLGEKNYRELPAYLREFDVCTLPFRMNRLTKAVDPVKVYEYLSQGKPVVSSPLPELEPMSELLYFAGTAEAFADQIDRALAEPREALERQRIEFARANTWSSRFAVLDEAVRARFPQVSILVVTHNTKEYLAPFFELLRRNTSYPSYEIVVVDNRSTDGSADELRRLAEGDPRVKLDLLDRNLGFAGGNNHAARMAGGEYLLLLNPDTIVTAGWIERLMRALEREPSAGVAAPVSNFSGNETKINTSYRTIDEMEDFAENLARKRRGQSIEIGVVPLFCGLLRRDLWDETGGLDEEFEIGMFEDDDFSQRVRGAGYRIVTAEDCFIHHFGNGSFAKLDPAESNRLFEKNRKRYESKWNTWTPHKTRDGVRPVSADSRVTLAEFFGEVHEGA